jgi:hypothetical protein
VDLQGTDNALEQGVNPMLFFHPLRNGDLNSHDTVGLATNILAQEYWH